MIKWGNLRLLIGGHSKKVFDKITGWFLREPYWYW
ncbi:hypothetical protein CIPAW_11G199700 [Carya illinoinensis]|uniref:Uncharacterized protein n=1 Tax=Carya illinoinensis TaxID=32201 RepID=A0A8T1P679_CARIL|nr:hypothetical protein CIPAW_11G199700 [Carya illinoinensis]